MIQFLCSPEPGKNSCKSKGQKIQPGITYSFAAPADKIQIRELLSVCGLPTRYVHRYLKSLLGAKAAEEIVGVVGVEVYGRAGLFRSLCVSPAYRARGIAKALNERMLAYARLRKVKRVYLFTLKAEKFAAKMGFRKLEKTKIPRSIRATWQFRSFKPYPVICMVKEISRLRTGTPSRPSSPPQL
ncbi:MAG TPA: GNAT family N-acetyltransferase [Syntrophales bacterium]